MCGEMAGDPLAAMLLLGLGLYEFSMSALSIPRIKKLIRSIRYEDAKKLSETALNLESGEEVQEYIKNTLEKLKITI
jgi:phosphotransferase system enzyme I (PtsI)